MKIKSSLLSSMHLNADFCLATARSVNLLIAFFDLLDVHGKGYLNDIQFGCFMRHATDLSAAEIRKVMDMLDRCGTGHVDFGAFYPLVCLLVAIKDGMEKNFLVQHSRFAFKMLDEDDEGTLSARDMKKNGFIFNLKQDSIRDIFLKFDISGDDQLSFKEFKMFTMAAMDRQNEQERSGIQNKATPASEDTSDATFRSDSFSYT